MKKYLLTFLLLPLFANAVEGTQSVLPTMTTEEACLTKTVWMESGNQSIKGQLSVVAVVFNRMKKQRMSACQVVMQKGAFSWYRGKHSLTPTERSVKLLPLVRMALKDKREGKFVDYTNGATHFHTRNSKPYWSHPKHTIKLVTIQDHSFYRVNSKRKGNDGL